MIFFNDRRANKRALKKANGPSLASNKNKIEAVTNKILERDNVHFEANRMDGTRKEKYAAAAKSVEAKGADDPWTKKMTRGGK